MSFFAPRRRQSKGFPFPAFYGILSVAGCASHADVGLFGLAEERGLFYTGTRNSGKVGCPMSKTVVVYRTKYGSTRKYAQWIAEETNADLFEARSVRAGMLDAYDTIIYGGGLYAGGILGFSAIRKQLDLLPDKKRIVFAVGATLQKENARKEVADRNRLSEIRGQVHFFLLRGGLDYQRMNCFDRFLMFLLVRSLKAKKPEELDNDAKGILATYGKTVDFTNRKAIAPILDCLRLL